MSTLQRALEIAVQAHAGQCQKHDRDEPYITHPIGVMNKVSTMPEKIVAILHDVLEDTSVTADQLRAEGFSEEILAALDCVTQRPGEPYPEFILRCAANPIARAVKLADLEHNFNLPRSLLRSSTLRSDVRRLARYSASHQFLTGSLDQTSYLALMQQISQEIGAQAPI